MSNLEPEPEIILSARERQAYRRMADQLDADYQASLRAERGDSRPHPEGVKSTASAIPKGHIAMMGDFEPPQNR